MSSVAKWAFAVMMLISLSQLVVFLAVTHAATKVLEGSGTQHPLHLPGGGAADGAAVGEAAGEELGTGVRGASAAERPLIATPSPQQTAPQVTPRVVDGGGSLARGHSSSSSSSSHVDRQLAGNPSLPKSDVSGGDGGGTEFPKFELQRVTAVTLPPRLRELGLRTGARGSAEPQRQPQPQPQPQQRAKFNGDAPRPVTVPPAFETGQPRPRPPQPQPRAVGRITAQRTERMPHHGSPSVASPSQLPRPVASAPAAKRWVAHEPVPLLRVRGDIHEGAPTTATTDPSHRRLVSATPPARLVSLKDAALLVLCYDRADYLTKTLLAVQAATLQAGIKKYVSQDGDEVETQAVAQSFERFHYMTHPRTLPRVLRQNTTDPELMTKPTPSTMFLAAHYKWALDRVFLEFNHTHAIILEDDMKVSKDFFQFFEMLSPLLDLDPTLWCISSWNDNGFAHFDLPASRLFRTSHFPGLGWMLRRELWLELREAFPEDNWDHWMRASTTSKNRECIAPFLSRNFNIGVGGATSNKYFYEQYLKTIKYNSAREPEAAAVALGDVSYLLHDKYFEIVREMTGAAGPSEAFREALAPAHRHLVSTTARRSEPPTIIDAPMVGIKGEAGFESGKTYLITYTKEQYENLATQLSLHPTPRTHFRHTTWLLVRGANVFLIDRRRSPFAHASFRKAPHPGLRAIPARGPGMGCNAVCQEASSGWKCSPEQFDFVNDCLVLAHFFGGCPYGCTQGWGEDLPATEIWSIGHKPMCLTTEVTSMCDAEFAHTQRLCPCVAHGGAAARAPGMQAVAAAALNTNCDEVCAAYRGSSSSSGGGGDGSTNTNATAASWRCDSTQFEFVNTCQTLKKAFGCAQCDINAGPDLPNFVAARSDANHGKCLMMRGEMTCQGAHRNTRRLCPCVPDA